MSLEFDHCSNKVNTIWGVHQVADSLAAPMTLNESRHWQIFHFHFLSKPQGKALKPTTYPVTRVLMRVRSLIFGQRVTKISNQ